MIWPELYVKWPTKAESRIAELPLHDKKALLWLGNLETWAHKGHRDLDIRIHEAKAARRAKSLG